MARTAARQTFLWAEVKHWLGFWLPSFLFAAMIVGLTILVMIILPQMYFRDIEGKTLQHGRGVITSITYGVANQYGRTDPDEVLIAMGNPLVTYSYSNSSERLRRGQHVQVSYRIGKSGNVYVAEVMPEGEAKP